MLKDLDLPALPENMRWNFRRVELDYVLPVLSIQYLKKPRFGKARWEDLDSVAPSKSFANYSTENAILKAAKVLVERNGLDKEFFKYFGTKP